MIRGDHTSGRAAGALFIVSTLLSAGCYVADDADDDSDTDTDTDVGSATEQPTSSGNDTDDTSDSDPTSDTDDTSDTDPDTDDTTTGVDPPDPNASLEALIGALCTWDFQCCSEGEIDYRLGPFTVDANDCSERYIEQLYSNDDVAETERADLLFTLGFAVRLDRSNVDPDAADDCREQIEARDCAELADETCEPVDDITANPCDLRNLFAGQQTVGEACGSALASLGFDIECVAGSSCEEVDGSYVCVDKGLVDDFCEADFTCDEGLYCNIENGRCRQQSDLGEECAFENPDQPDAGTELTPCKAHLTCDPASNTCVQFCASGYDCEIDAQCSVGQSCIPVDVDENTYTYCLDRGDTNGDRCDTHHDCVDNFHCESDSCVADRAQGTACDDDGQCQAGLYCDLNGSEECEVVLNANIPCDDDRECNPTTTLGCMTSDDGSRCRTALLGNDDACTPLENDGNNWCQSGLCENIADDGHPDPRCHPGASVGDACDDAPATQDILRCARDLYCDVDQCAPQLGAGGDCGDDGSAQCLGGSCAEIWEGDYCTDAVPTDDVGETLTCDGQG